MAEIQLTQAQQAAVDNRGGSLLVSAAAGSGKTKVLVERLFAYMERERCDVDDFLIITYTKAAAAELRGKIAAELSRRVAAHPESGHLRRQLFRVYQADIKTVDAFCAAVLRENVHLLPGDGQHALTPDFRVLDEQEAQLLRERVLERVMETFYARLEGGDAEGELLAETLGAGRDDRALTALVLEEHSKIQSHPYPLAWLEQVYAQWEQTPQALADCTAYAYAAFHSRFLAGRVCLIGCPKLDGVDYAEKLTEILCRNTIRSVTILRMEVPCCGGLEMAAKRAIQASGKFLPWQVATVHIDGTVTQD